ncbi:MAG: GTPase ObgE [Candidatus Izemoplasmatales bacterium]|jgi:GTP-binding protein|nr:GTPase ObgE [Candidatus Izemoplasmatales bacterium]MDY0372594.1 GTPase ObgE [Candidatus Izemoplasmatales bacterium]
MFIDEVTLQVQSGKGGDGIIAFRREKHVPLGGPSGGDGGKGGSVLFEADEGLSTLFDLRYQKFIRAQAGENGKNKNMRGKDAEDVIIKVPVGTLIYLEETNQVLADLTSHRQQALIAKGGRGGRGNASFATSRNKAPRIQENGDPSETLSLRIELKLLADVGIIGFPSVGKSTLISAISGSKPKIADYPFTTLIPNLGVVEMPPIPPFVVADMPGIIEGAAKGSGLGIQFLKHIERTRVLLHMIDFSDTSGRDPYKDYLIIQNELASYHFNLSQRPQIIVANKMDLPGFSSRLDAFKHSLKDAIPVVAISAQERLHLKELVALTYQTLQNAPYFSLTEEPVIQDSVLYKYEKKEPEIRVEIISDHLFEVSGKEVERLYYRTGFQSEEALQRFFRQLRLLGVDDKLRSLGAKHGDTIHIFDSEFEFFDK